MRIHDQPLHRLDTRLFGQFLERASWGEPGPECAADPQSGRLRADVLELVRQLRPPVIRFPGGTDIDYIDWRDLIDHVPGRDAARPRETKGRGGLITNRYGFDEFLADCAALGSAPLVVCNLRDALMAPAAEVAALSRRNAAAMVAYCNGQLGCGLDDEMEGYVRARHLNGHPEPWRVPYVQIGNETGILLRQMREARVADPEGHYGFCLRAAIDAVRAVDPHVRIIADAFDLPVARISAQYADDIDFLAVHAYTPWSIEQIERDGRAIRYEELSEEEIWYAWVSGQAVDQDGRSQLHPVYRELVDLSTAAGVPVAMTEWNWNGGFWGRKGAYDSLLAKGVGAASYLHAMMRRGDAVVMGCQSMLVGCGWEIAAVRVDRDGALPPHHRPSGLATGLYASWHGDRILRIDDDDLPVYRQPLRLGAFFPTERVRLVDVVVSADDRRVYVHAINRSLDATQEIRIDAAALGPLRDAATQHAVVGRVANRAAPGEGPACAWIEQRPIAVAGPSFALALPPRSVSVTVLERA